MNRCISCMIKSEVIEYDHCAICFEQMKDVDATHLSCLHGFHKTCIAEWLNVTNSCPMCRTVVTLNDDSIIYIPPCTHRRNDYTGFICGMLIVFLSFAFNCCMLTFMMWVGTSLVFYISTMMMIIVNVCTFWFTHRWFTDCCSRVT